MALEQPSGQLPDNWQVECSDEENYFEPSVSYRYSSNGARIWEPCGEDIAQLYQEIEQFGYNRLEWQCPGRISPSQLVEEDNVGQPDSASRDKQTNKQAKSQFDFDNDFDDTASFSATNPASRVTKRTSSATRKSQTNLSKVMQDIKKYQMIDQVKGSKSKPTTGNSRSHSQESVSNSTSSGFDFDG